MPDIPTIGAALSSLKTAIDITKFLKDSDSSLERAEFKVKLADLLGSLADTKLELIDLQNELAEKEKKIADLEQSFENKNTLIRQNDAYYVCDETGKATGKPYCLRCWENDHKQRQLVNDSKEYRIKCCTSCGHKYSGSSTQEIYPERSQPAQGNG